jgi:hypothetical protein
VKGVPERAREVDCYRLHELRRLRQRVEFLERERVRLERLLGFMLRVAVAGTACGPLDLLDVAAELLELRPTGVGPAVDQRPRALGARRPIVVHRPNPPEVGAA